MDFKKIGSVISSFPMFAGKTAVVIVTFASAIILFKQLSNNAYLVEPLQVPFSLAESGYTPEVTAQWVVDRMLAIKREATTIKEDSQPIAPDAERFDMEVPGSGISLGTIGQALRESLGFQEKTISGEVVSSGDGFLLRLRISEGSGFSQVTVPNHDVDALIDAAAERAVQVTAPFMFASYLYAKGRTTELEKAIDYCLDNGPQEDRAWAFNLRGIALDEAGNWDGAIENYEKALQENPRLAVAYNNWANTLRNQGKYEDALEKLQDAVKLNADLVTPEMEANFLFSVGVQSIRSIEGSRELEMYRLAIEKNPHHVHALLRWGQALMRSPISDFQGAIEKFGRLEEIRRNEIDTQFEAEDWAGVYILWGQALEKLGDDKTAISKYQDAIVIDPVGSDWLLDEIERIDRRLTDQAED